MMIRKSIVFAAVVLMAIAVTVFAGFAGTDVFVASAGHGQGSGSSQWRTTLWINNPGDSAADCQVQFLLRNQENGNPLTYNLTVQPGDTLKFEDATWTLFGIEGYGALRIVSNTEVVVGSRIFNQPGSDISDTQGQYFSAMPASFSIGAEESTDVIGVNQATDDAFRFNFGMVETTGHSTSVDVTLYDGAGSNLGGKAYSLAPFEARQVNLSDLGAGTQPVENGRLHFAVSGDSTGKLIAFGSGIANTSQDPTTFEMLYQQSAGEGDITAVNAGDGLDGGGDSGDVTLEIADNGVTPRKISDNAVRRAKIKDGAVTAPKLGTSNAPVSGQSLSYNGTTMEWVTPVGTGDITAVSTGNGLTGGGTSGDVTLSVATSGITTSMLGQNAVTSNKISSEGAVAGQVLKASGGTAVWGDAMTLPYSGSASTSGDLFFLTNTGNGRGLRVNTTGDTGIWAVSTSGYAGVHGQNTTGSGVHGDSVEGDGVVGSSGGTNRSGVYGSTTNSSGFGVYGRGVGQAWAYLGGEGRGIVANVDNLFGYRAGYFVGDVDVAGNLSKSSGSFKIDHPLDPEGKYLYHSFVESPDMMNVYNGNVILDADGSAWITLPDWFEALNRDFRYQLTPIGGPAPNLYVEKEVEGNHFRIAGGPPALKVSWMVTGIRHDAWAEAHRIPVEEEKVPAEYGTYIHPELYGQSEEFNVEWATHPQSAPTEIRERLLSRSH